ncbi:MAG: type II toxin-antitoxin system VapC family toxin [Nanoarchaeota archaeon]|nr:type II toxin-antitoxin system VapC family toxin [Nanoarchaeota archaeon]
MFKMPFFKHLDIIKWFTQEEGRERAIRIREQFLMGEVYIIIPDLILYEIANALRFNPYFTSQDIQNAIESIYNSGVDIVAPLSTTLKRSVETALTKDITIYDSFYVTLAEEIGAKFVTADKKLHTKTKEMGFVRLL